VIKTTGKENKGHRGRGKGKMEEEGGKVWSKGWGGGSLWTC
jgi:hypothetical protein